MKCFVALVVIAFTIIGVAGCAGPQAKQPAPSAQAPVVQAAAVQALDEKANAVRLQAAVYEIRLAPEKVGQLDAGRLAATDFSRFPSDLGHARPLYLFDQSVSLSGDRLMTGSEEPMVANTRTTDRGQRINSISYNSVGAIIQFKGERVGPTRLQVTSTIEMSAVTEGGVQVAEGTSANVIRKASMSLKGPVDLGKPSVLISADASSRDKDGNAVVYVARLVLGAAPAGTNP